MIQDYEQVKGEIVCSQGDKSRDDPPALCQEEGVNSEAGGAKAKLRLVVNNPDRPETPPGPSVAAVAGKTGGDKKAIVDYFAVLQSPTTPPDTFQQTEQRLLDLIDRMPQGYIVDMCLSQLQPNTLLRAESLAEMLYTQRPRTFAEKMLSVVTGALRGQGGQFSADKAKKWLYRFVDDSTGVAERSIPLIGGSSLLAMEDDVAGVLFARAPGQFIDKTLPCLLAVLRSPDQSSLTLPRAAGWLVGFMQTKPDKAYDIAAKVKQSAQPELLAGIPGLKQAVDNALAQGPVPSRKVRRQERWGVPEWPL